jgi:hypothetical protein
LRRYQKKNWCGPHEFGFKARNSDKYIYVDLVRSSNEAGYLKYSIACKDASYLYALIVSLNVSTTCFSFLILSLSYSWFFTCDELSR